MVEWSTQVTLWSASAVDETNKRMAANARLMIFLFIIISPSSYSVVDHRTLSCAGTAGALARGAPRVRNRNQPHPPPLDCAAVRTGPNGGNEMPGFLQTHNITYRRQMQACLHISIRPARRVCPQSHAALLPSVPPCCPSSPARFATQPRPARLFARKNAGAKHALLRRGVLSVRYRCQLKFRPLTTGMSFDLYIY